MSTITLTVEKDPENPPGGLLLSDSNGNRSKDLKTDVKYKDKVKWKLKTDSGITSIDGIIDKSTFNLFEEGPTPKNNGDWEGTIGDWPEGSIETYNVEVTINEVQYNQDPKLIMTKP